jgi:hypothetical protein
MAARVVLDEASAASGRHGRGGAGRGRHTVATRPLGTGDVALREAPAAIAPAAFVPHVCGHCLGPLPAAAPGVSGGGGGGGAAAAVVRRSHPRCARCGLGFCSAACQGRYGRQHELECAALQELLGLQFSTPQVETYTAVLVLRLIVQRRLYAEQQQQQEEEEEEEEEEEWQPGGTAGSFAAAMALESHQAELRHAQPTVYAQLIVLAEGMSQLLAQPPLPRPATDPPLGVGLAADHYLQLLCAVRINAFAVGWARGGPGGGGGLSSPSSAVHDHTAARCTAVHASSGAALALQMAMVNHSCAASSNCRVVQEWAAGWPPPPPQQLSSSWDDDSMAPRCPMWLTLRAKRDIAEGERQEQTTVVALGGHTAAATVQTAVCGLQVRSSPLITRGWAGTRSSAPRATAAAAATTTTTTMTALAGHDGDGGYQKRSTSRARARYACCRRVYREPWILCM